MSADEFGDGVTEAEHLTRVERQRDKALATNADHLLRADLLRARIVELENECDHAGNILGRIGALLDDYEHINVPDPADLDEQETP